MSAPSAISNSMTSHKFPWKWYLKDLAQPSADAPTVFSLFSCGGGSSMGYKLAGFKVEGCCEIDPRINEIYNKNLHPEHNYVMDVRDFLKLEDLPDSLYNLDVLDGSPPCSTFSMSGDREKAWGKEKRFAEGQKLQTLDDLFFVYLDIVEKLRPKVSIAENVTGLLRGNAKGYVNLIVKRYKEIGYKLQLFQLNAATMGVPQARERVFFIATRLDVDPLDLRFDEPPIKFGEVRSATGDKPCSPAAKKLIAQAKPNELCLGDVLERLGEKRRRFNEKIISDEMVCPTLISGGTSYRKCDSMTLSKQDMINVQTFPQDYDFCDSSISKIKFICGMSVPPLMMANIAAEVKRQWLDAYKKM